MREEESNMDGWERRVVEGALMDRAVPDSAASGRRADPNPAGIALAAPPRTERVHTTAGRDDV